MTEWRGEAVEAPVAQMKIKFETGPCVKGGVGLLRGSELIGLPVCKTLSLRYSLAEYYRIDFLKRYISDTEIFDIALEIDEALGVYVARTAEHAEVIVNRQPDFGNVRVLEKVLELGAYSYLIKTEQETPLHSGNLH